jgi:DNA-binding response OmpR family regulator
MNVLIVEDEKRMAELLSTGLKEEGHTTACAYDGEEGLSLARNYQFDVIVLDLMLPKLSGYEVARRLRAEHNPTAILVLTARDTVQDVVKGLDMGADDYLTKPFSFEELLARLRAVARRGISTGPKMQVADLVLDPSTREVFRGGEIINLTRTEYSLLEKLMRKSGHVVARQSLIESVWGFDREVEENTLDAFMRLLRNKIDRPGQPRLIHTSRGVGYYIRQEVR